MRDSRHSLNGNAGLFEFGSERASDDMTTSSSDEGRTTAGARSLAFRLRFRPPDRTLKDAEIDPRFVEGVLVEVKTGGSKLSRHEREVERAGREGRVRFETVRLS